MTAYTGDLTNYQHHQNAMRHIKKFQPDLQQKMRERDELYNREFIPRACVKAVWEAFNEIRQTKSYENCVNHTDIKNYTELMGFDFTPFEVKGIIRLDRAFYRYKDKHKNL